MVIDMLSQFKLGAFPDVVPDRLQPTAKWWSHPETFTEVERQRYRDSGINVFQIGWGTGPGDPHAGAVRVLGAWNTFIAEFHNDLMRVDGSAGLYALKRQKKIGIMLGFQNSDHFSRLTDVASFFGMGQRVSQLTYNVRNLIGTGYEEADDGLTTFGAGIVAQMNQVGMAVDASHCGPRTTLDACRVSKRPVLFTHANCQALVRHSRCKSDEEIRAMAATGGVMGITGVRMFVKAGEPTSIDDVLDHFDHVARLVGVEHVGVGSDIDLDGYDKLPPAMRARMLSGYKDSPAFRGQGDIEGLNHPRRMFDLTEGLIRRGYSDADIERILGGNFMRALIEIWSGSG
jgi:membrane dipeptidase